MTDTLRSRLAPAAAEFGHRITVTLDGAPAEVEVCGRYDVATIVVDQTDGAGRCRLRLVAVEDLAAPAAVPPAPATPAQTPAESPAAWTPPPLKPGHSWGPWGPPIRPFALPFDVVRGDVVMVTDCWEGPAEPFRVATLSANRMHLTGRKPGWHMDGFMHAGLVIRRATPEEARNAPSLADEAPARAAPPPAERTGKPERTATFPVRSAAEHIATPPPRQRPQQLALF